MSTRRTTALKMQAVHNATITLDPGGLRSLAIGASAAQLERNHQVSIDGDKMAARALLDAISGPRLFQRFRELAASPAGQSTGA